MKYEVIGWTDYDCRTAECAPVDDDAVEAVIADIREHGYMFTGYHHQEYPNCVPVLSDGYCRLFSRRNFAAVMAKAHGYNEPMDYVFFMEDFSIREEALHFPSFGRTYFPPDLNSDEDEELGRLELDEDDIAYGEGESTVSTEDYLDFLRRFMDGRKPADSTETDTETETDGGEEE